MAQRTDLARGRDLVARWCVLAEQRLDYLTELFETGRWRRYHSEIAFLENIQEAKAAVETWRELLTREASRVTRSRQVWTAILASRIFSRKTASVWKRRQRPVSNSSVR